MPSQDFGVCTIPMPGETQPSSTKVTHGDKLAPFATPGARGCLTARSADGSAQLERCRFVDGDGARTVRVTLAAVARPEVKRTATGPSRRSTRKRATPATSCR
jgi:hypothetical protein